MSPFAEMDAGSERIRFRATAQEDIAAGALVTGIVDRKTGVMIVRNARQLDHYNAPDRLDPEPEWEGFNEAIARARADMPVCTDPDCTIKQKPGFPKHGPHDFRAGTRPAPPEQGAP